MNCRHKIFTGLMMAIAANVMGCANSDFCGPDGLIDPSGHWVGRLTRISNNCPDASAEFIDAEHEIFSECVLDSSELTLLDEQNRSYSQESFSDFGGGSFTMRGTFSVGARREDVKIRYRNADGSLADVTLTISRSRNNLPDCEVKYSGQMNK